MIYREIGRKKMTQFLDYDKIVFDDITVDWCITFIFNKIMALDSIRTFDMFQGKYSIMMWGDLTSQYDEIYKFLTYSDRNWMPFYIMFCIILNFGLVDRKHFKLYNELLALVLGRCGVFHAEVNDTEYVVVGENGEGNRYGNGRVRPEWAEQDR